MLSMEGQPSPAKSPAGDWDQDLEPVGLSPCSFCALATALCPCPLPHSVLSISALCTGESRHRSWGVSTSGTP